MNDAQFEVKVSEMSNSELMKTLTSYENEYEVLKSNISAAVEKMNMLDFEYERIKDELKKRKVL